MITMDCSSLEYSLVVVAVKMRSYYTHTVHISHIDKHKVITPEVGHLNSFIKLLLKSY